MVTLGGNLCGYAGKITLNPSLGQVKIVAIRETSNWESVPQSSSSREEAVRVEFTSHQWNMGGGMWVIYYNVSSMAVPSHKG